MKYKFTYRPFCTILKAYSNKKDHMISGFLKQGWARFVFSDITTTLSEVSSKLSLTNKEKQEELGIAFNTSLILNSFLHGEERVKLISQYETDNILTTIYSESISNGEIRGFLEENQINDSKDYSNFLKVSKILYNHNQEVSGIIKLQSNKLTHEDIYNYFEQSEQIRTHIFFTHRDLKSFISQGFILQKMPDCDLEELLILYNKIIQNKYFKIIQEDGLSSDLVYNMFDNLNLEVELKRTPIQFLCRCSMTQFVSLLINLGKETLIDMRNKNQRTLTCQTCRSSHILKDEDFDNLIDSLKE